MESPVQVLMGSCLGVCVLMAVGMVGKLLLLWWVIPRSTYRKLKANGFSGPKPSFPVGNLYDMKRVNNIKPSPSSIPTISHDIHSIALPYYARWQKLHGKVLLYWLGTEPFVYVADPEFLKQMTANINGKSWGKPTVYKHDRKPVFGNGLLMVEGDDWVRHRHVINPAFTPSNLKCMASSVAESATKLVDRLGGLINSGHPEIDVEREMVNTIGEMVAKTSFGVTGQTGHELLEKVREIQITLFNYYRYVGVPYGKLFNPQLTLKAVALGKEIDTLLHSIIVDRRSKPPAENDLLDRMLADSTPEKGALTTREVVDEFKTIFFAGYETTALALTWSMLLLALHPEWQNQLREEIKQVIGDGDAIDATMLAGLKKMGWVMNETLRLYPNAPNSQRQARQDIRVGNIVIPKGTNIWIDIVSMHHDEDFWGKDVHEFKPERFDENIYGGCNHKMGYLPFGFGGRMCIGRNLSVMEYKIVLTLILTHFSFSPSPNYCHEPSLMLSLRPRHGMPLIFKPL